MSTSINNAFIKRSMYMPKGVGYGASSMGKVKKASIVVVPKNEKVRKKVEKEERKKKSDGHKSKKSDTSRDGAKRTIKNFKKRTRQGV